VIEVRLRYQLMESSPSGKPWFGKKWKEDVKMFRPIIL